MFFKELEIKNFRNYEYCKEAFHPEINIFIGENGQGKTNLAESIYLMCLGRSFRTQKYKEMIKFKEDYSYVKSLVHKKERNIRTEVILNRSEGKKIKINGVVKKPAALSDNILIVVFSPEDLKIVKEEPDKRRRFINREISQLSPVYYEALTGYTKVLNNRNALLKSDKINSSLIDVWDEELIKYGMKIISERRKFIEKLNIISSEIHSNITEKKENLIVEYDSDIEIGNIESEIADNFRKSLKESFSNDMMRGITSHGPHRDDLKIVINGIDVRKYGSQGQQRTAALSLKLAEIKLIEEEKEDKPILILDDVLSELDNSRQHYLISSLKGVQIFLTSASISEEILSKFEEKFIFEIKEGKVINKL